MKTKILKSILALLLTFMALPMMGQDYLKIYFKDGHTERHYMKLVQSISATKYDLEGNLHDDYQMQQIVMPDTTYSYYIDDIDSVSFRKVDEEQVKKNVESVANSINPIFEQCYTIEEMEAHLNQIKDIDGVEDVWRAGDDIVVQIRDWHKVYFTFPIVPQTTKAQLIKTARAINTRPIMHKAPLKSDGTLIKVAIAFQMNGDSRFSDAKELDLELKNHFKQMGFDAHFIPDEETGEVLDIDFYERRMFEYDIVFIDTHGGYSSGKHSFYTSIKPGFWYQVGEDLEDIFDIDDISYGSCRTGEGLLDFGNFKIVSEDFIRKGNYNFTGPGPHIVFSGACRTFQGTKTLTIEHKGQKQDIQGCSSSVAEVFFNKGADICLGYSSSTSYSSEAAYDFFSNMLNGASQEIAFSILDTNLKYEADNKSYLIDLINPNSEFENPKSIFLFKPHTEEVNKEAVNIEYYQNHTVTINGDATLFNVDGIKGAGFTLSYYDPVEHMVKVNAEIVPASFANHKVKFSAKLENLVMGRKYSYCAYTYDGLYYNYGEPCSFTIEAPTDIPAEAIDLGLPSGTKWASYNVGASKPEEYGNYYAWGETETKDSYTWDNYIHCDGTKETCHNIGADIAGTDYDVAHKLWGDRWTMPTKAQINELTKQCTKEWTTLNGVKGCKITGPNGNSIFLPAAGFAVYDYLPYKPDVYGMYMSSTMCEDDIAENWYLDADENNFVRAGVWKYYGFSVRPVISPEPVIVENADQPLDLGLPSGTLWAQCNLGASQPHELGNYYAWGETKPKEKYDMASYALYNSRTDTYTDIGTNISGTKYDAAHVTLGGTWHMPTYAEFTELKDECEWKYTVMNGVNGYRVTGPNGKSIFLPCADSKENESAYPAAPSDTYGHYWSSMGMANDPGYAYSLNFNEKDVWWPHGYLSFIGFSIRPAMTK